MRLKFRADQVAKNMAAYQCKEDEEMVGERLGHSPLMRARELFAIQASALQAGRQLGIHDVIIIYPG